MTSPRHRVIRHRPRAGSSSKTRVWLAFGIVVASLPTYSFVIPRAGWLTAAVVAMTSTTATVMAPGVERVQRSRPSEFSRVVFTLWALAALLLIAGFGVPWAFGWPQAVGSWINVGVVVLAVVGTMRWLRRRVLRERASAREAHAG